MGHPTKYLTSTPQNYQVIKKGGKSKKPSEAKGGLKIYDRQLMVTQYQGTEKGRGVKTKDSLNKLRTLVNK